MAVALETAIMRQIQEIMCEIGLDCNYNKLSSSCKNIRITAIKELPGVLKKHDLSLSELWNEKIHEANQADQFDLGKYSLTNVWNACLYAICDALLRAAGGEGLDSSQFQFHFSDNRNFRGWERQKQAQESFKNYLELTP